MISPNIHYEDWFHIGCAIHKTLGEAGYGHWDDWSQGGSTYDDSPHNRYQSKMQFKWDECGKVAGYNEETIYWHADQADPDWRATYLLLLEKENA